MAGKIGWLARSGGGPGRVESLVVRWGMDLWSKEFSEVNIFTSYLSRIFNQLQRIFDFTKEKCILT